MATQTNNLLLVEAGVTRTLDATNDALSIGAATTFTKVLTTSAGLAVTGDATVSGNLEVTGDIVSRGSSNLLIRDPIIDLAVGNSGVTATPGGFTVQMNRNSSFTAGTVTTFVAGVPATSAPTFTYTDAGSSTLLVAGDVVAIYGSDDASNDGLYVVDSVDVASFPQVVTIKGVGGTAVGGYTPFAQNQFTADTGNTAEAYKIDLAVGLFADGTSSFKDGGGGNYAKGTFITAYKADASDSDFSGNGDYTVPTGSLQDAYVSGNTITTSGGDGNLVVAGTEKLEVTATNGVEISNLLDLNGSLDADVTSFAVDSSGAISLDSTSTASNFTLTANDAGTATLTLAATNSGAGVADLDVDADGAVTIDAVGAVSLGAGAASDFTVSTGDLSLTATASSVVVTGGEAAADAVRVVASNAAGGIDIDAGTAGIAIDTTGPLSLDSTALSSNLALSANSGSNATLTIESINAGAGAANLDINVKSAITIDSASISIDATTGSNLTVTGSNQSLTLQAAGGGTQKVTISSAGTGSDAIDVNATAGGIDVDATGTIAVDTTGVLSLQGGDSTDLTMAANSASAKTLTVDAQNSGAGSATLRLDADDFIELGDPGSPPSVIKLNAFAEFVQSAGLDGIAGVDLAPGDAVYVKYDGSTGPRYYKAANNAVSDDERNVMGLSAETVTTGNNFQLQCVAGLTVISGMSGLANTDIGKPVYLGTAGALTLTAPTSSGTTVFRVGYVQNNSGPGGATVIHFLPQFIAKNP